MEGLGLVQGCRLLGGGWAWSQGEVAGSWALLPPSQAASWVSTDASQRGTLGLLHHFSLKGKLFSSPGQGIKWGCFGGPVSLVLTAQKQSCVAVHGTLRGDFHCPCLYQGHCSREGRDTPPPISEIPVCR